MGRGEGGVLDARTRRPQLGPYLEVPVQEEGRDGGAVEGPRPGAGQPHGVVRVHVRQEEEPRRPGPAQAPEVHRDGRVRDQHAVHGGGRAVTAGSASPQPCGRSPPDGSPGKSRPGSGTESPEGAAKRSKRPCPAERHAHPPRAGAPSKRAPPAGQAEVADFRSPAAPPDRARPPSPGEVAGREGEGHAEVCARPRSAPPGRS